MQRVQCRPYVRGVGGVHPPFHLAPRSGNNWDIGALCKAYNWPTTGQPGGTVGIIEMGGGYRASDIQAYCQHYGYAVPKLTDVPMDLSNSPGQDADVEVVLDIEAAIAAAAEAGSPLKEVRIYFAQDFVEAIQKADADGCDTFSISWGSQELQFGAEYLQQIDAAVVATKMSVYAAAGDGGSTDTRAVGPPRGANLDGPSCCPHIVSCGGTTKYPSGNPAEFVWTGTGGGISVIFPQQPWQTGAPQATGRTSPDIAANADPVTGVLIYMNGSWSAIGGTSFVAPLMAGLFATFGRRLGFITDKLYASPAAFTDIATGSNGQYRATSGVDFCTGVGVPIGTKVAALFMGGVSPPPPPIGPPPPPIGPPPPPPVGGTITGTLSGLTGTVTGPFGGSYPVSLPSQKVTITTP